MINITQALQIQGWMSEPELYWLAEQARKHITIVEAGSYCGRSARAIADNMHEGTLHCVDPWDGKRQIYGQIVHQNGTDINFNQFLCNLNDKIKSGKVKYHVMNFTEFYMHRPDMIFIDAIHEYDPVKQDILHALKMMNGNGLICGHDYHDVWPEVIQAVDEIFGKGVVKVEHTIWWYEL